MEALQGRVSGLDITKSSGQAGSGVSMQLRGNRSLVSGGTSPLFIIDGMPGDYSTLNPNDIESIEVLKDASSTAIYGSSGANGVVLITTKGGKSGKLAVNFNAYYGINGWSDVPEVRQGETYMEGLRQAAKNAGTYVDDATLSRVIRTTIQPIRTERTSSGLMNCFIQEQFKTTQFLFPAVQTRQRLTCL